MPDYIVHKAVELDNLSAKAKAAITETEWIVSPKYDGCHAIFCFDGGKHVATYSRTGEAVRSMDHIARSLLDLYPLSVGRIAIQGEAWMLGKEFNEISGAFRRHAPQPELQFVPFEIVPFDYNDEVASGPPVLLGQMNHRPYPAPYRVRFETLRTARRDVVSQVLAPTFYFLQAGSVDEAKALADVYAKHYKQSPIASYDGAVLAQANGKYSVGSGKGGEFIKVKPLIGETVTVTAVISDLGAKRQNNTCVLCFDLNGEIQKVSTGITQQQADDWAAAPEQIIGQRIEVEAMGLTVNGRLREPRFKGIRCDA